MGGGGPLSVPSDTAGSPDRNRTGRRGRRWPESSAARNQRHVGILAQGDRVREVVPAAPRERFQIPVALDEFEDRRMVRAGEVRQEG